MNVYLYSRVSTAEQTLQQQERSAYDWLDSHGLKVSEVVSDKNVSGKTSYKDRNLGRELLPKLQPGDILIVSEISRLGRSMFDVNVLINKEFLPRKTRLIVASMGIDLNCNNIKAADQMLLTHFSFGAQLEIELNSDRTTHALEVRKKKLKEQGYFINKNGQRCTGLGAASENYKVSNRTFAEGRLKSAKKKNRSTVEKDEFKSFCRILNRTFDIVQGGADLLQADVDLFERRLTLGLDAQKVSSIIKQMYDAHLDNKDLFGKYVLDCNNQKTIRAIRSKIRSTVKTIKTYQIYNKL